MIYSVELCYLTVSSQPGEAAIVTMPNVYLADLAADKETPVWM